MNGSINLKIGKYVVLYIIATYILYLFLPIKGFHSNDLKEIYTIVFLSFVCLAFYYGCKSIPIKKQPITNIPSLTIISPSVLWLLLIAVSADIWLYLLDLVKFGAAQFSFAMGDNYKSLLFNDQVMQTSTWGRLFVLFSPLRIFLIAYCVYLYNNIGNEFDINYQNDIMQLRAKYEVQQYELSKGDENEEEDKNI